MKIRQKKVEIIERKVEERREKKVTYKHKRKDRRVRESEGW